MGLDYTLTFESSAGTTGNHREICQHALLPVCSFVCSDVYTDMQMTNMFLLTALTSCQA